MPRSKVTPVSADHINDVLAACKEDTYELQCSEQAEAELTTAMRRLCRQMGHDAFLDAVIPLLLPHEERWRREVPNHPALKSIDRWREKNRLR